MPDYAMVDLYDGMNRAFSEDDVRSLCFFLSASDSRLADLDYSNIPATKSLGIQSIIDYCHDRNAVPVLVTVLQQRFPYVLANLSQHPADPAPPAPTNAANIPAPADVASQAPHSKPTPIPWTKLASSAGAVALLLIIAILFLGRNAGSNQSLAQATATLSATNIASLPTRVATLPSATTIASALSTLTLVLPVDTYSLPAIPNSTETAANQLDDRWVKLDRPNFDTYYCAVRTAGSVAKLTQAVNPGPLDWACYSPTPQKVGGVDMAAACHILNNGSTVHPSLGNPDDANSWNCDDGTSKLGPAPIATYCQVKYLYGDAALEARNDVQAAYRWDCVAPAPISTIDVAATCDW